MEPFWEGVYFKITEDLNKGFGFLVKMIKVGCDCGQGKCVDTGI